MAEYPRILEGGDVREVIPHLYHFDSLESEHPVDSTVVRHADLVQTATELGYKELNGSRAFKMLYRSTLAYARAAGAYTRVYTPRGHREDWEYESTSTSPRELERRQHLGISLALVRAIYLKRIQATNRNYPPGAVPHFHNTIEALLFERGLLDPDWQETLEKIEHEQK